MRRLLLIAVVVLVPNVAWADLYTLTSAMQTSTCVGESPCTVPFGDLTGTMEISAVPTVIDEGDRYKVAYAIVFDFLFGDGMHIFGSGAIIVDGNGCGLFDCNMASYATNEFGNQYLWEVGNGAFFYPDGSPYPTLYRNHESALPYAVPPARFELYNNHLAYLSGPMDTFTSHHLPSALVARRIEGVPEPSTLLLLTMGLMIPVCRRRAQAKPIRRA